jgi:hypothetical protein
MVVVVKQKDSKKFLKVTVSLVVVAGIFVWYYFHMQDVYKEQELARLAQEQANLSPQNAKYSKKRNLSRSAKLENKIYREAQVIAGLVGQEYIQDMRISKDKLLIVCDSNVPLEAVEIRYGAIALMKKSKQNIKIAIDLGYIIKSSS